jgi:hypothetical protein
VFLVKQVHKTDIPVSHQSHIVWDCVASSLRSLQGCVELLKMMLPSYYKLVLLSNNCYHSESTDICSQLAASTHKHLNTSLQYSGGQIFCFKSEICILKQESFEMLSNSQSYNVEQSDLKTARTAMHKAYFKQGLA